MGGFMGPTMDTTVGGSIPSGDASTTGKRYQLIVSDKSLQTSSVNWKTANTSGPSATKTVWDGLTATRAMVSAGSMYPAAQAVAGMSYPTDDASEWYIPSMRELLALYWVFKPTTDSNYTTNETASTFPGGTVVQGADLSSDPQRAAFTTSVPAQTSIAGFQSAGAQPLVVGSSGFWTSTEYNSSQVWAMRFDTVQTGQLFGTNKFSGAGLRAVRRLVLA